MTEKLQPTALSIENAARLLTAASGRTISTDMISRDTDAGAPLNPDGTINLIHYAAWLAKERAQRGA